MPLPMKRILHITGTSLQRLCLKLWQFPVGICSDYLLQESVATICRRIFLSLFPVKIT